MNFEFEAEAKVDENTSASLVKGSKVIVVNKRKVGYIKTDAGCLM